MDDSRIVDLYLNRDETAIKETTEKYGSRLRCLAYSIVGDRQIAEECENDTYLGCWNSIPPHRPDPLKTYVCRKKSRRDALSFQHRAEAEQQL